HNRPANALATAWWRASVLATRSNAPCRVSIIIQPTAAPLFGAGAGLWLHHWALWNRATCRSQGGTDLLSPIAESRAQRLSSTALYPSCRRITRLHKTRLVCGGMTDTLLQV